MSASSQTSPPYSVLLDQNQCLRDLLHRIGDALQQRRQSVAEVGHLLAQLGDLLVKHFAMEESDGYLADALTHAPQLVSRANDLLRQHPQMAARAQTLVEFGAPRPSSQLWWEETQQRYAAFMGELLEHERREDRLIQEAYTNDIQASD